ncbi:ZNFX1 [Bugula neritina]|uniref:ZNFX1 n=1 Tax=Bugula neritina TaxID=10212 RepID=A0A7J7JRG6_BUGNE|nr:ZNFX1 [Bugula neritina]
MYLEPGVTYELPTGTSLTSPVPLQNFDEWPRAEEMGFNQSQYEAYKTALTKEFVVIQGPPGTGKTYVSLRIVETFIKNLFSSSSKLSSRRSETVTKWDNPAHCSVNKLPDRMNRPILVVCYTNHALDQFLEGILGFCKCSDTTVLLETESSVMHTLNKEAMTEDEVILLEEDCSANTVDIGHDLPVKERNQQDVTVLKRAKVIGMTTTAAARMQSVLQQVGPEIVVVEEAAEVLEAHIITALSKHCKHLILIGDHKQLKPSPTVYDLARHYHLDLSLFERMVNNGLPVKTLNIQHRMRPEVSKYMRHIYDGLDDHSSVENRLSVKGMAKYVFFFNHQNPEEEEQGLMSKSNTFEVDMVVALASNICVTAGEESDIIILSLVRSNKEGKSGFVKIENRVCVSLSRAKLGMYVFGNFDMICKDSEVWTKIVKDAQACGEFGEELNLSCVRHSEPALVKTPEDFKKKAPLGCSFNEFI